MDARCATGNNATNLDYNADRQSRLAIAVAKPTEAVTLSLEEGNARLLLDSGRWTEVLVPFDDGKRHVIVAGYYGIAGASNDASQYKMNEQLIHWAMLRMLSFSNTPYILAGDFNVDPAASEVIQHAINTGKVLDACQEWAPDKNDLHPTFCRAGVFEGMKGPQKTRIDTFLVNQLAAALTQNVSFNWDLGRKYDHARLVLELSVGVANQKVQRTTPVIPISIENFAFDPPDKATPEDIKHCRQFAEDSFKAHWALFSEKFQEQIEAEDIDGAHETWCSAAEIWLFLNQQHEMDEKVFSSKRVARRGTIIPFQTQDLVETTRRSKDAALMGYCGEKKTMLGRAHEVKTIMLKAKQYGQDLSRRWQDTLRSKEQVEAMESIIKKCEGSGLSIKVRREEKGEIRTPMTPSSVARHSDSLIENESHTHVVPGSKPDEDESVSKVMKVSAMWDGVSSGDSLLKAATEMEKCIQEESGAVSRQTAATLRKQKRLQLSDPKNGYAGMMQSIKPFKGNAINVVVKEDGMLTSNVQEIHGLFRDTWDGIYNRLANSPPCFEKFKDEYDDYIRCAPTGDLCPSAQQLYDKARAARVNAAPGLDGWRPSELKKLPLDAWVQRHQLLRLVKKIGKWPSAYLRVAAPSLRKADRLDPDALRSPPTAKEVRSCPFALSCTGLRLERGFTTTCHGLSSTCTQGALVAEKGWRP